MGYRRVAVAGGYTAGHVHAGLAFLHAYRELGAETCFIGCTGGMEERLVPAHDVRFETIPGAPFQRQGLAGKLDASLTAARGALDARRLLSRLRIELLITVGGYASVGAALAAKSLAIPIVIHEANIVPGLANRLLAPISTRICTGFEETRFRQPFTPTGNPVLLRIQERRPSSRTRFLVTGGSLGSGFLNLEAPRLLARLRDLDIEVRHAAGAFDLHPIRRAYQDAGLDARVDSFIAGMGDCYAASDFVIACPGALTLAEIALAGLPALLVPLGSAAGDHQSHNARVFASRTGALWCSERDWDNDRLAASIRSLLRDPADLEALCRKTAALARPHAARDLVRICEAIASQSR